MLLKQEQLQAASGNYPLRFRSRFLFPTLHSLLLKRLCCSAERYSSTVEDLFVPYVAAGGARCTEPLCQSNNNFTKSLHTL